MMRYIYFFFLHTSRAANSFFYTQCAANSFFSTHVALILFLHTCATKSHFFLPLHVPPILFFSLHTSRAANSHSFFFQRVDIYSYGVVVWELLTREEPWREMNFMSEIESAVRAGQRLKIPSFCPRGLSQLIR